VLLRKAGEPVTSEQTTLVTEDAGDTADTEPEDVPRPDKRDKRNWLWLGCVVALVVLLLGFLGLGTYSYLRQHSADEAAARDHAILTSARNELTLLANLQHTTARDQVTKLRDGATGAFLDQFSGTDNAFFALLDQGQVDSTGKVTEAAVQRSDDSTADVLVAVSATVRNTDFPTGQQRDYRSLLSLRNDGGRWLVADAKVVP
jgi:Mce-associated membrane protein